MNSNFIGRNKASFNCSGQGSYDVKIPEYLNCYDQSQIGVFDEIGCFFMDLCGNNLDFINDEPLILKKRSSITLMSY